MTRQRKSQYKKYVSGWVSPEQYAKVGTLATIKGKSASAVLRELIDQAIVRPQNAKNGAGDREVTPNAVLS